MIPVGCGGGIRTLDLRVMSPTSCRCSTPRREDLLYPPPSPSSNRCTGSVRPLHLGEQVAVSDEPFPRGEVAQGLVGPDGVGANLPVGEDSRERSQVEPRVGYLDELGEVSAARPFDASVELRAPRWLGEEPDPQLAGDQGV